MVIYFQGTHYVVEYFFFREKGIFFLKRDLPQKRKSKTKARSASPLLTPSRLTIVLALFAFRVLKKRGCEQRSLMEVRLLSAK